MELASCHLSDAQNFELAPRFLENLHIPHAANQVLHFIEPKGSLPHQTS
jgi:hypothetical protein